MKIMLLGHMGRDEALASRLGAHGLHIVGQWENPGLMDKATASGGTFHKVDSVTDTERIADLAEHIAPDMFLTNCDDALAAGVVDTIKQRVASGRLNDDLYIPSPDRSAARIEWDKFYLRELINEIAPEYNPVNFMVEHPAAVNDAIDYFKSRDTEIAIKPRGLTGGKGVKVMCKHFDSFDEGRTYALGCLEGSDHAGVEIQEKLVGHEFTLQLFTDGTTLIRPPATYDYPYREDSDTGPGTGGMGAFSMEDGLLPFVSQTEYDEVIDLMGRLLAALRTRGHEYRGVLYPTFFKTTSGLKIVETNARGGDPELINIIDLMEDDVDVAEMLKSIATGTLTEGKVRYKKCASAMLYLVSPDYGYRSGSPYTFTLDTSAVESLGCHVRFAAAERIDGDRYRTVGSSRSVGISALGKTTWEARAKLHEAIERGFGQPLPLKYRHDIAQKAYIDRLS